MAREVNTNEGFLRDHVENIDDVEVHTESTGPRGREMASGRHDEVTTGRAAVRWNLFAADAEGPLAGVGAYGRHIPKTPIAELGAMSEASLRKVGVTAGPLCAEANLNVSTGARIGTMGVEANFLGFGCSVGNITAFRTPGGTLGIRF